jgi:hypothetical protein
MDESKEPPSGWKRARDTFNRARLTAEVVVTTANPLYGPVAQHAHLEPVANPQEIVRQIDERENHEYAEWELRNREEEAGQVVRTENPARQDKSRPMRSDPQVSKSRSRDRQRGR